MQVITCYFETAEARTFLIGKGLDENMLLNSHMKVVDVVHCAVWILDQQF